jgi:hypothetical protein
LGEAAKTDFIFAAKKATQKSLIFCGQKKAKLILF